MPDITKAIQKIIATKFAMQSLVVLAVFSGLYFAPDIDLTINLQIGSNHHGE